MSNSLDPDQAQHFVGSDLGPNCLQRLSADDKSRYWWGRVRSTSLFLFLPESYVVGKALLMSNHDICFSWRLLIRSALLFLFLYMDGEIRKISVLFD